MNYDDLKDINIKLSPKDLDYLIYLLDKELSNKHYESKYLIKIGKLYNKMTKCKGVYLESCKNIF